jgi:hypothetical protein
MTACFLAALRLPGIPDPAYGLALDRAVKNGGVR